LLPDAATDGREKRRVREAEKRKIIDQEYVKEYSKHLRQCHPKMPKGLEKEIAEHACLKYSGRVGRSEGARKFNRQTIALAVIAHIRHTKMRYDELLMRGHDRQEARSIVRGKIEDILDKWEGIPRFEGTEEINEAGIELSIPARDINCGMRLEA
jgi:hypothetical protein